MKGAIRPTHGLAALVAGMVAAVAMIGAAGAQPQRDSSLILYVSPPSSAQLASEPVELWTTNGVGANARRLKVVVPPPGRSFEGARLTRLGDVIYAVRAADGFHDNLFLIDPSNASLPLHVQRPRPDDLRAVAGRSANRIRQTAADRWEARHVRC